MEFYFIGLFTICDSDQRQGWRKQKLVDGQGGWDGEQAGDQTDKKASGNLADVIYLTGHGEHGDAHV